MGIRVNIQYSVDLDDLEMEVVRMIKETGNKLEGYGEDLGHLVGLSADRPSLSLGTLKDLMEFRVKIAKVDYALEDMANIISGYLRYELEPEESQLPAMEAGEQLEPAEETTAAPPPNIEQIQKMINNFKNSMETDEVSD